jgi:hypothetical protein
MLPIVRRSDTLGERLRRAAEQIEDAEFREVDDATGEQKHAA